MLLIVLTLFRRSGRFSIVEKGSMLFEDDRSYPSLAEILNAHKTVLKFPYDSELARISWFHGGNFLPC